MNYLLKSDESIILRDGRPFGEEGMFGGNSLLWPLPHTLAGMVRTKVGLSRDQDYFRNSKNAESLKQEITLNAIQPYLGMDKEPLPLVQIPADVVFNDGATGKLKTSLLQYQKLPPTQGTDLRNREWLIPFSNTRDKPSKHHPAFLHWAYYEKYYLNHTEEGEMAFEHFGVTPPIPSERFHNALDAHSRITQQGALYKNSGFYLKTRSTPPNAPKHQNCSCDLFIYLSVQGETDKLQGNVYLGGERKQANLEPTEIKFPGCPNQFSNKPFLKLVLQTHGDFGDWCPAWLKPDLQKDSIEWVVLPGSSLQIRLRSAVIQGWDGISGWDYPSNKPKAMRKMVRPGAVFLLEVNHPEESQNIAETLWGKTLCQEGSQSAKDGFGRVLVANANVQLS
ncbi:type III-B CRISPR module-associated Cmr3 family protein [Deltaproteobacteria bacterium TL4]